MLNSRLKNAEVYWYSAHLAQGTKNDIILFFHLTCVWQIFSSLPSRKYDSKQLSDMFIFHKKILVVKISAFKIKNKHRLGTKTTT